MKALYATVLLCALSQPLFAQQRQQSIEATPSVSSIATLPARGEERGRVEGNKLDTLMGNLMQSSGFVLYSYSPDPKNPGMMAPLTGTNDMFVALGETFNFSGAGTVSGVLVAFRDKQINGKPDMLMAEVLMCDSADNPSGALSASQYFSTASIDTGSSMVSFTPITFTKSSPVTGNFSIFLQTNGMPSGDSTDMVTIFTNQQGDGKGHHRLYYVTVDPSTGQMGVGNLSDLVNVAGAPLDIDLAVAPIVDMSSTSAGVQEFPTLNGVTLKGAYPNPASHSTSIELSLREASPVEVKIIDMRGKVLQTLNQGNLEAGEHRIEVGLEGITPGDYLYSITTNKGEVAGKFAVSR